MSELSTFTGTVEVFDLEMGWHYVSVPTELVDPWRHRAERGLIAITAHLGEHSWSTSLLPKGDGTHFIALAAPLRKKAGITVDDSVTLSFEPRIR